MAFSSALQWWQEWQLRILVLGSLGVQCFLAVFAGARKSNIRPLSRFLIWLSYLGSDALAIYSLATLFNRQSKVQRNSPDSSRDLEVLWTPILLMHLGGQVTITAYNIEDNELWRRHIVTAISQVTVALYVFYTPWSPSADKRLLTAAILLFIPGVFKCFEKPLALKCASFNTLVSSLSEDEALARKSASFNIIFSSLSADDIPTKSTNREIELEEYIQKARDFVKRDKDPAKFPVHHLGFRAYKWPAKCFTDFICAYAERFSILEYFWLLNDEEADEVLRKGLSDLFALLYTKDRLSKISHDSFYHFARLTRMVTITLSILAIGLFHGSHKKVYWASDVNVTYVLLYITFLLEIYSLLALYLFFFWTWPDTVPQHSLIGFFARNKRHTWLMKIMGYLQCRDFFDKCWCTCNSSEDITKLVRGHVKDAWLDYILDAESYRAFSDIRGHWILKGKRCGQLVTESIEKAFDESILLWHVATDFCFHRIGASPDQECSRTREISNYMMHLLFANPDMLMPGSRISLFAAAYEEIEEYLPLVEHPPLADENGLTQKLIDKVASSSRKGFIHDAWRLSQELMQLGDEKMWEVIKGVWIEMLCFSAGRCRGYLHAKSLGSGGEYLTFVSLLMSYAGLETFAERQQRVQLQLPKEERVKIAMQRIQQQQAASNQATDPLAPQGTVPLKDEENAATPSASEASGPPKQEENAATASSAIEVVVSP